MTRASLSAKAHKRRSIAPYSCLHLLVELGAYGCSGSFRRGAPLFTVSELQNASAQIKL
jgi:hypothetical protein